MRRAHGGRSGEPPHERRRVRLGCAVGEQFLDRALALVAGQVEQLDVVCRREVRGEQLDAGQVDLAAAHSVQDGRIRPGRTGRLDPVVGRRLREVQDPGAVREHRGKAQLEMELARLDLAEMQEKIRSDALVERNQLAQLSQQYVIGDGRKGSDHGVSFEEGGVSLDLYHDALRVVTMRRARRSKSCATPLKARRPSRPLKRYQGIEHTRSAD